MERRENTQVTEIEWSGINIEIRFTENWLNGTAHHLELRVGQPLSVTLTGYKSHFFQAEAGVDLDMIVSWVIDWLDKAAEDRAWQDHVEQSRQGDLFDL